MIQVRPPKTVGLRKPRWTAPRGAVDAHFHIFGPEERYPYIPQRTFTPADVSTADYLSVCSVIGIERAVLVQPSGYGTDNRRQLEAGRELTFPTRAVVVVPIDVDEAELNRLHAQGARGVRVVGIAKGGIPLHQIERLGARLAERGWHIQLLIDVDQLIALGSRLLALPCDIVIDHFAHVPASGGMNQPGFKVLQSLIDSGRGWMKLSGGYRMSHLPPPHVDAIPLVQHLVGRRPDRFVWGSDWPHVVLEGDVPDTVDVFDLLADWVPDEDTRNRIMVDNPERLYGFDPV